MIKGVGNLCYMQKKKKRDSGNGSNGNFFLKKWGRGFREG